MESNFEMNKLKDNENPDSLKNEAIIKQEDSSIEVIENGIDNIKGVIDKLKKIKEALAVFPNDFKIGIISIGVLFGSLELFELWKKQTAEDEFLKTKNLLNEYVISNNLEKEDYSKAKDLFGEHNLEWFNESLSRNNKKFSRDTNEINKEINWQPPNNLKAFEFFTTNEYIDKFQKIQRKIEFLRNKKTKQGDDIEIIEWATPVFGAENLDTLHTETFTKIINETYPKNWFKGEVNSIYFTEESYSSTNYGDTFQSSGYFEIESQDIVFLEFERIYKKNFYSFFITLSHEAGHANDWRNNNSLNPKERLNLLMNIGERLTEDDRLISDYVEETIQNENPQDKLYNKATEYWAEICGEYFTNGPDNLSEKDVNLIENVIKIKDPDFNIAKSINDRAFIIKHNIFKESSKEATEYQELLNLELKLSEAYQEVQLFSKIGLAIGYKFPHKKRHEALNNFSEAIENYNKKYKTEVDIWRLKEKIYQKYK